MFESFLSWSLSFHVGALHHKQACIQSNTDVKTIYMTIKTNVDCIEAEETDIILYIDTL